MLNLHLSFHCGITALVLALAANAIAQSREPYTHATTDRLIHQKKSMALPPVNKPFTDPDFGWMVRATDSKTNFKVPGSYL